MDRPVLIVTVTKVEALSVIKIFAPTDNKALKRRSIGKKTYYELGIHGNVPVLMVQSEMGSGTPGGAILTVSQAIQDIQPQAVIMCGIAFGLRPDKQKLGDILIARQILCYESQKIDIYQGQIPRGDRVMASTRLLDRFRSADNNWTGAKTYFGLVMSGEKLVNDPDFRSWLLQNEPEAIGGEMEGAGLYVAARDTDAEWIMVKSICDWGDGNKNSDAQPLAAENAAEFVFHVLQQGGLSGFEHSGSIGNSSTSYTMPEVLHNHQKSIKKQNPIVATQPNGSKQIPKYEKAVFVSYAWGGESERTVDELEHAFANRGISIVRDKGHLAYKGSIKEFEKRLGRGRCVVLVISDKYLRSEHCMYELVKIDENQNFRNRIFPIVLADALIYEAEKRIGYIEHWEKKISTLNQSIKRVGKASHLAEITANLEKIEYIRTKFDHLIQLLSDMNALTPEIHATSGFSTLISAVETVLIGLPSKPYRQSDQPKQAEILASPQLDAPNNSEVDRSELIWLSDVGLKENPFRYQNAEDNDPYLSKYFSRFPDLETVTAQDLTSERKTWFFWGKEGSGKTALRKFLTARVRPQKTASDIFGIEVDRVKFEQLVFSIDDISEFLTHFIRYVYETCLQKFPVEPIKSVSWHNQSDLQENLANLSVSLRQHGINWVLCLIDPSKDFFTWKGSQVSTSSLLAPLLSFPDIGGFGFRYFLSESVKVELQKTLSILPRGQRRLMQIEWDEETIKKLIGKRMTTLSLDQSAPYRSLGELCDDDKNLSSLIDAEIASLAQGNPRAAIWLANRLIEMHCQLPVPANRISPQTWDEVKRIWWSSVESRMLDVLESSQFRVLGEHIFFQKHEIILSGRSDQLLRSLAKAKGGFCSKEELIMAGWPGENLVGVSEKALSEAIRRTKDELKDQLSAKGFEEFDWIKSVRKRGYKLVYPGMDTKVGEEDYE